jgi:hypothetical protein
MSNVIPFNTKLDHRQESFDSIGDMEMVTGLLKKAPYCIPEHLRGKIVETAGSMLDNPNATEAQTISAAKLLLEADKINVQLIKLAVPTKHEHFTPQKATTAELCEIIRKANKLMPELPSEIIENH